MHELEIALLLGSDAQRQHTKAAVGHRHAGAAERGEHPPNEERRREAAPAGEHDERQAQRPAARRTRPAQGDVPEAEDLTLAERDEATPSEWWREIAQWDVYRFL